MCDTLTVEIEHIDTATLEELSKEGKEVQPLASTLETYSGQVRPKSRTREHGVPLPEFEKIDTADDLRACGKKWEYPFMLKSRLGAYDGKGNAVVHDETEIKRRLRNSEESRREHFRRAMGALCEGIGSYGRPRTQK